MEESREGRKGREAGQTKWTEKLRADKSVGDVHLKEFAINNRGGSNLDSDS